MDKKTKIITIGNLKGGVGKSTLTIMFANYLFSLGKSVIVIDADDYQQTIGEIRKQDLESNSLSEDSLFDLKTSNSSEVPSLLKKIIGHYDYVFIDLPGNIKQKGVSTCYLLCDVFFIPMSLNREDIDATIKYVSFLYEDIIPLRKKHDANTQIFGILTKVNKTSKEYKDFQNKKMSFPFVKEIVPNSQTFVRKISTANKMYHITKTFNSGVLYKEIGQILNV